MQKYGANHGASHLAGREQTWSILVEAGAHLHWLPRMVDTVVTHWPGATSMAEILELPDHYRRFEDGNRLYSYSDIRWEAPLAEISLTDRRLLDRYLDRQARQALKRLKEAVTSEKLEDAKAVYLSEMVSRAAAYRPGRIDSTGAVHEWGYEAYLANHVLPRATREILRNLKFQRLTAWHPAETDDPEPSDPLDRIAGAEAVSFAGIDLRAVLKDVLAE